MNEEALFELEEVDMTEEDKNGHMFLFEEETINPPAKPIPRSKQAGYIETRGRKKKPETDILVRQTFLVTEEIKKALKIKATTEGLQLNEMVRNIFLDAIEPHYIENLKE